MKWLMTRPCEKNGAKARVCRFERSDADCRNLSVEKDDWEIPMSLVKKIAR
jgi:hypothetical protein